MLRGSGRGSSSASAPGFRGVFSFLGMLLIIAGTFTQALEANLGGFLSCVLAALVGIAAFWTLFRVHGWLRIPAGLGLPLLSAYALHAITAGSGGASWFWELVVFLLVGFDQWIIRSLKR
jgi:hypothetical protein